MKCPDAPWDEGSNGEHKFDKDGFCIFCGNKATQELKGRRINESRI